MKKKTKNKVHIFDKDSKYRHNKTLCIEVIGTLVTLEENADTLEMERQKMKNHNEFCSKYIVSGQNED